MSETTTEQRDVPEGAPVTPSGAATAPTPAQVVEVEEALRDVVDPELGVNIVDLGLIYGLAVDDANHAVIDMTLTSAACPLTDVIEDQTAAALADVVAGHSINWVWMPPWGPEKITDDGREQLQALGFNMSGTRSALVPLHRAQGWLERFSAAHGAAGLVAGGDGGVRLTAQDGTRARWSCTGRDLAEGSEPGAQLAPEDVLVRLAEPATALVLLLRRGGAVAGVVVAGGRAGSGEALAVPPARVVDARVRTARVQSRTAAGGWSQQRFARRRAGQAAGLVRDAAETASLVWRERAGEADLLSVGGDRALLEACLHRLAPDLARVRSLPRQELALPADPRRRVLDALAGDVGALRVEVTDP